MLLGTTQHNRAISHAIVSIPREDSCFWELKHPQHPRSMKFGFNPQRGFMLLGTYSLFGLTRKPKFQSPERIHAFGNTFDRVAAQQTFVSIPREDSCFWELMKDEAYGTKNPSFNPQRGFMLLGTKQFRNRHQPMTRFNPQRGFMLLGTIISKNMNVIRVCFNPQRGFMLLGTQWILTQRSCLRHV